jgi:hypothetical protein
MRVSAISAAAMAFGLVSAGSFKQTATDSEVCAEPTASVTPTWSIPSKPTDWTTSTILSTTTYTVTKCPKTVTKCPAESITVTTEVITVGTTVCPVSSDWPKWTAPAGSFTYSTAPTFAPTGGAPVKPTSSVPITAGAGKAAAVPVLAAAAGIAAFFL